MDCIINPLTKRAVKIDSSAGRRALKYNKTNNLTDLHECVINPRTKRAVKKDSALGRKILKELNSKPPPPKPPEPPKTTPKRKEFSTIFSYYDNKTNKPRIKSKEEQDADERFYQKLIKGQRLKKC